MAVGGFNCPWCRYYNAVNERRCGRCDKWLPPRAIAPLVARLRAEELWATKLLAGICVLAYALEMAASGGKLALFSGMKVSTLLRFGAVSNGLEHGEPWRLLAACFLHMGILHIVMNLVGLADLGRLGEPMVGGPRFLLTFVVTGILGFLTSAWWYGTDPYITAGASGAVFGIDGMILGDMMARKDPRWRGMLGRTVIYSFVFYFAMRTNQAAHLGGLVVGIVMGVLFRFESRPWKIAWLVTSLTALSIVAIVVSLVLPHFSPVWRVVEEMERQRDELRQAPDDS